jgi:cellulose synthase/poly-beta-1,6-N-acetylglucosamine synthase-like glycosyltransferase
MLFIALFAQVYFRTGLLSWAVGIVYIIYDTALLLFVAVQTRVMRAPPLSLSAPIKVTLGVVIAAYNEATVLEATIEALRRQDVPPEEIVVADDGSDDGG